MEVGLTDGARGSLDNPGVDFAREIAHLVRPEGVDRDEVRGYFEKSGLLERWRELEASL